MTDSLKNKYTNQTIFRSGSYFLKGTERLSFRGLAGEFKQSELGTELYMQAVKSRTVSTVMRFAALASGFVALGIASHNNLSDRQRNTAFVFLGGQFVLGLTSAYYTARSQTAVDRALWERNKDILFPAR